MEREVSGTSRRNSVIHPLTGNVTKIPSFLPYQQHTIYQQLLYPIRIPLGPRDSAYQSNVTAFTLPNLTPNPTPLSSSPKIPAHNPAFTTAKSGSASGCLHKHLTKREGPVVAANLQVGMGSGAALQY
jgi:hypothetical protein